MAGPRALPTGMLWGSGPLVGSHARCSGVRSCPGAAAGMGGRWALSTPLLRGKQDFRRSKTFSIAIKLAIFLACSRLQSWLVAAAPPASWQHARAGSGPADVDFQTSEIPLTTLWLLRKQPQGHAVGSCPCVEVLGCGLDAWLPHAMSSTAPTSLRLLTHPGPPQRSSIPQTP